MIKEVREMKKEYFAPEAEKILFLTESLMGPSFILNPEDGSAGGDDDVTEFLPTVNLFP